MNAKIVIIGAGASGIAAATKLISFGFKNVMVLEAQDRIGGRIHTVAFGDNFIDLGAQWCHGEKNNVVYDLVKDKGFLDTTGDHIYENVECIRSNGDKVPTEIGNKLKEIADDCLYSDVGDLHNFEGSLASYLREKFLKNSELAHIDRNIIEEYLKYYHSLEMSEDGCDNLFEVSAKGQVEYRYCEGDDLNWKDKGFVILLRTLMKSDGVDFGILNKKIFLNKEVVNIDWDENGLQPTKIQTASGIEIQADHVICTVSLAVLKENFQNNFNPKLPENKLRAIRGLGIGTVNKVFLHFEERWWSEDWTGFAVLWRNDDLIELRKSKYFWLEDVFGFYVVKYQPNVLSSWVTGHSAKYVETLSRAEQMEGIMYLLKKCLKKIIPQPIDFLITNWHSNRFVKGSYSHRSMETEHLETGASDLAEPISSLTGRPLLQFAGEATHDHFYSTVHGAVQSGWREADRLYQYYNDKK